MDPNLFGRQHHLGELLTQVQVREHQLENYLLYNQDLLYNLEVHHCNQRLNEKG